MVVKLDPWQTVVALKTTDDVEYIIASADFFTPTRSDYVTSELLEGADGFFDPPDDYSATALLSITTQTAYTGRNYNESMLFYDAQGRFLGNPEAEEVVIEGAPVTPIVSSLTEFANLIGFLRADLGATVDPLFAPYKAPVTVGYYEGFKFTGASDFFRVGNPPSQHQLWRQAVHLDNAFQVNVLPSGATYRGNSFAPIAVRKSGPFSTSFGFIDISLSVLFKRST